MERAHLIADGRPRGVAPGRPVVSGYEYSLLILIATLALGMTALWIDHSRGHRIHTRMEVP